MSSVAKMINQDINQRMKVKKKPKPTPKPRPKPVKKKGNTGNRYTEAQRKQVLNFMKGRGRGAITLAMRKFGISYVAIRRWVKMGPTTKKMGRPKLNDEARAIRQLRKTLQAMKRALANI